MEGFFGFEEEEEVGDEPIIEPGQNNFVTDSFRAWKRF